MADASKKRKHVTVPGATSLAKRPRFPQRPQHHIPTQPTKNAYPNGEVNVKNFLKSHENEIKSLENAMRAAKKGLSRRAFQDVPRELRRRTASHNPNRVPKRLRARARQEAKEDNTPISRGTSGSGIGKGKKKYLRKDGIEKSRQAWEQRAKRRKDKSNGNGDAMDVDEKENDTAATKPERPRQKKPQFPSLATPATPPSRFRRRQRVKTWLPTHVWHSKRARMTDPKEPLWRFAIPLQPAVKSYRLTHRATTQRGAVAWDMSYMSIISLEGAEASIVNMLKGLHFAQETSEDPWQDRGKAKKWRAGTRTWEGWLYDRTKESNKVAPVTIIWCAAGADSKKRKVFIRVHPSAFLQLWEDVIRIAKMQKPVVAVEDLRFEIGSIEIMGPAASEALCSILKPATLAEDASDATRTLWPLLASITDVSALPPGALLGFNVTDPRLHDPPTTADTRQDEETMNTLMEHLAMWPIDTHHSPSCLYDRKFRLTAQRSMPSQKSINRRKSACTLGELPEARPTDPRIPVQLYASRENKSWTLMLPWKCVQPIWRGIMRYPVSTGGNPRFGGLKERRQVNFERFVPQFPFDYPGTNAGWVWECQQRQQRKHEWTKRPKGKRIEWSTIDLGNSKKGEIGDPWACDWEHLLRKERSTKDKPVEYLESVSPFLQLSTQQAVSLLNGSLPLAKFSSADDSHLFAVKITMAQRGTPTDCARVYRLPSDKKLREQWLSLLLQPESTRQESSYRNSYSSDVPEHIRRRDLARSLLEPHPQHDGPPKAGEEGYPAVPDEEDLIGFVTTGNYNLAEGRPTAVASIALHKIMDHEAVNEGVSKEGRICIVRQAGSTIGRLAKWEVV